jgi:UDP-N-acetylglucosamine--dolichyl-phosphate N-acetylglucosaminephosphotransferase
VVPLLFEIIIVFFLGLIGSALSLPKIMEIMQKKGVTGIDVHKKDRPLVPEMGGIAVLIGLFISVLVASLLMPTKTVLLVSFFATSFIAGLIGALDDVKTLNSKVKPFLTLFASLPILLMGTYNPNGPFFPLIGQTRLTIVYPILIPIAIAVTSNAVNMMDPFNGTMSGTSVLITVFLLISGFLLGRPDTLIMCVCILGPLVAFYFFNRYPSKVFSGDVGSLAIGASLGAVAIIGQIEVVAIIAFAPQIMNAFYGLSTLGRLYERREVPRPVTVLDDGRLKATKNREAPITLARLILARGPLYEYEAVRIFMILSVVSGILAVFTAYLMLVIL